MHDRCGYLAKRPRGVCAPPPHPRPLQRLAVFQIRERKKKNHVLQPGGLLVRDRALEAVDKAASLSSSQTFLNAAGGWSWKDLRSSTHSPRWHRVLQHNFSRPSAKDRGRTCMQRGPDAAPPVRRPVSHSPMPCVRGVDQVWRLLIDELVRCAMNADPRASTYAWHFVFCSKESACRGAGSISCSLLG